MPRTNTVMIKGTKEGLSLILSDTCSFEEVLEELDAKLALAEKFKDENHRIKVRIHTGNRLLTDEQIARVEEIVMKERNLLIDAIEANVLSKEEADRLIKETRVHMVNRIIRSGQVLKVQGDLLLVGDVNPGGKVVATGNIFIMGKLKGIAHAGYPNNRKAVIVCGKMIPEQLRIADLLTRAPDEDKVTRQETECAYINQDNEIIIDRLPVLRTIRPELNRYIEGGE